MNKIYPLVLLFTLFSVSFQAQINFESGYFIDNTGEKITCLIKNVDWKNNPTEFQYKLLENSEVLSRTIDNTKQFEIQGESKFIRTNVKINISSDLNKDLDFDNNIKFEDQTLWLKVLIEGAATLYYYENGNFRRFFFATSATNLNQLIYKRFYYTKEKADAEKQLNSTAKVSSFTIGKNVTFRQQIWNTMKCDLISRSALNKLPYQKDNLAQIFKKYNKCIDPNWAETKRSGNNLDFNISIRPGLNFSSLNLIQRETTSFDSKISLRIGLELELVLPFNKNKWALVLEPTYRNYQSTTLLSSPFIPEPRVLDVDYSSIEFTAGIRYYAFLSSSSKISLSGYIYNDMELNASVSSPNFTSSRVDINAFSNFGLGIGYKLKNKFSAEARYDFDRGLIRSNTYSSEFKNVSLILGYTIL